AEDLDAIAEPLLQRGPDPEPDRPDELLAVGGKHQLGQPGPELWAVDPLARRREQQLLDQLDEVGVVVVAGPAALVDVKREPELRRHQLTSAAPSSTSSLLPLMSTSPSPPSIVMPSPLHVMVVPAIVITTCGSSPSVISTLSESVIKTLR